MHQRYSGTSAAVTGLAAAAWKKSSRCAGGDCVEVARLSTGLVGVRDGKRRQSDEVLIFSGQAWDTFLAGVRGGDFG